MAVFKKYLSLYLQGNTHNILSFLKINKCIYNLVSNSFLL